MSQLTFDLADPGRDKVGRSHADGPDTEKIAAALVAPRTGSQREKVLQAMRTVGPHGVTDNELHFVHGIGARPHVPGTRREELIADGWPIVDTGRRRKTDTGAPAIVWRLVETGAYLPSGCQKNGWPLSSKAP